MNKILKIIFAVLSTIGTLTIIVVLWEFTVKPILMDDNSNNNPNPNPTVTQTPLSTPPPTNPSISLEERFSSGDRRLFINKPNPQVDQGIAAFKAGNYDEAKQFFTDGIKADQKDPEVQIYLNNSEARKKGNPFVLAAVVPVDTKATNAEEMLRGVADAQTKFNKQGLNNRLLEIMIVNDSNEPDIAQKVAQKLANNSAILGVIGHNSSSASASALIQYEKAGIPMISPTSTSTSLFSNVFFRTVPSDAKAGEILARYAIDDNINKVAIFYTSASNYSTSLKDAFIKYFEQLGKVSIFDLSLTNFNAKNTVEVLQNQVDSFVLLPNTEQDITNLSLQVAKANYQLSTPMKLLGGDALYNPATLTFGGDAVEGLVLAVPWFAKDTYFYTNTAAKRWGGRVSWRTATSYDATQALINALSTDATRNTVLNQLKQTNLSREDTSGETLQFLRNGDRNTDPILVKVIKGLKNAPEGSHYSFEIINE
ncbi:ABC transporter substrate-binding protein [Crocosphaera sp. UHCC 0190]|uniref:ABC transporter substrate-binding protein n=1 Tax=Crocosphaera sp. UHCC 0190 TaxID=3110246 RepID=UPI002B20D4CE|nr:ABC transporter substrate-binding protein [Crocosphaera sp. UHCC 0190]MEA5508726.1 ABC transporter substrate-binding protein [Crocosphaera sp. UHCC 0190]